MRIRTLAAALTLTVAAALALPAAAEARHRHSRHCRHRHGVVYEHGYRYSPPYDRGSYDHRYYDRSYYDRSYYDRGFYFGYGYGPPPRSGYLYRRVWYPRPRLYVHYHGRVRCSRSHLSIGFRW